MMCAYMAEINLSMNTRYRNNERLEAGLSAIDELLAVTKPSPMDLRYTRANCLNAMRRDEEAVREYRRALEDKTHQNYHSIGAQCWKNMGTSLERLRLSSEAMAAYDEALRLDPDLAEARLALAHCHAREKNFTKAADLVDGIARRKSSALDRNTIQGWKAHYRSLTKAPDKALDIIHELVGSGHEAKWIWPWSAGLVRRIGRSSPAALAKALTYWRRYLHEHPGDKLAERQRLLSLWSLRQQLSDEETSEKPGTVKDGAVDVSLEQFRERALRLIEDEYDEAFWWDRIGHWAQADGDWEEAENAYRRAYALQPRDYEYCLGTTLNLLDRCKEAVPLLASAAAFHDDSIGWYQLGVAHAGLRDWAAAVAAYESAIERDPNEPKSWFNLGGAHWNAHNHVAARQTWQHALQRFPNDAAAEKAREFLRGLECEAK